MKIITWNVNGIRAAETKGLYQWMRIEQPEFLCIQETKAQQEQLTKKFKEQSGYEVFFSDAEKKGYSGTAIYTRIKPENVTTLGIDEFDAEGRTVVLEYKNFNIVSAYFPNSQEAGKRLDYKLRFCDALLDYANRVVASGKDIIICGDYNIAHTAIDLANPKSNEKNPGYLPEEREWMTKFINAGYCDSFRLFNKEGGNYTWWSYRSNAREKNVGWRIDYACINESSKGRISSAKIHADVFGSDHCPYEIEIDYKQGIDYEI